MKKNYILNLPLLIFTFFIFSILTIFIFIVKIDTMLVNISFIILFIIFFLFFSSRFYINDKSLIYHIGWKQKVFSKPIEYNIEKKNFLGIFAFGKIDIYQNKMVPSFTYYYFSFENTIKLFEVDLKVIVNKSNDILIENEEKEFLFEFQKIEGVLFSIITFILLFFFFTFFSGAIALKTFISLLITLIISPPIFIKIDEQCLTINRTWIVSEKIYLKDIESVEYIGSSKDKIFASTKVGHFYRKKNLCINLKLIDGVGNYSGKIYGAYCYYLGLKCNDDILKYLNQLHS